MATFANLGGETFQAELISADGRKIPESRDFDPATGSLKDPALLVLDEKAAGDLLLRIRNAPASGNQSGKQTLHHAPLSALYHQHTSAGGQPKIRLYRPAYHANRPKPLRDRAYHLHAHRLHQSRLRGHRGRPRFGPVAVRRRISPPAAASLSNQGQKRPGSARSHPPRRTRLRFPRVPAKQAQPRSIQTL